MASIYSIMFEAYRRNDMANIRQDPRTLTERWLGLGTISAYRPAIDKGLMRWIDGPAPHKYCRGRLVLTTSGAVLLQELSTEFNKILCKMKDDKRYITALSTNYQLCPSIFLSKKWLNDYAKTH